VTSRPHTDEAFKRQGDDLKKTDKSVIRVAIADDHAVVREGVKSVLSGIEGMSFVGEAGDSEQAVALHAEISPDVMLLDIAMPGTNGMETLKQILKQDAQACILIFSIYLFITIRSSGYIL